MAWPHSRIDPLVGDVEVEAYSADIMAGAKRLKHLRAPMIRDYKGRRYVIVLDDGDVIAVYRTSPGRPRDPVQLTAWPFDNDDASLT